MGSLEGGWPLGLCRILNEVFMVKLHNKTVYIVSKSKDQGLMHQHRWKLLWRIFQEADKLKSTQLNIFMTFMILSKVVSKFGHRRQNSIPQLP